MKLLFAHNSGQKWSPDNFHKKCTKIFRMYKLFVHQSQWESIQLCELQGMYAFFRSHIIRTLLCDAITDLRYFTTASHERVHVVFRVRHNVFQTVGWPSFIYGLLQYSKLAPPATKTHVGEQTRHCGIMISVNFFFWWKIKLNMCVVFVFLM